MGIERKRSRHADVSAGHIGDALWQSWLNEALLWDGAGSAWERVAWVDVVPYRVYLPWFSSDAQRPRLQR